MFRLLIVLMLILPLLALAQYDPPEIIGILSGQQEPDYTFGSEFICIGDQNGDGYDDLLVSQTEADSSRVYIFHGGEDYIDDEPAFIISPYENDDDVDFDLALYAAYLGRIKPDTPPLCVFLNRVRTDPVHFRLDLYAVGDELGNEPIVRNGIGVHAVEYYSISEGHLLRPLDFNGDGWNDILRFLRFDLFEPMVMQVCFGGADYDTIADWSVDLARNSTNALYGFDYNGDRYGDIINRSEGLYNIYLGGDSPDTTSVLSIGGGDLYLGGTDHSAFIPDMNGDGYDEICIGWHFIPSRPDDPRPEESGYYVFLGSEEPDNEPDLQLETTPDVWEDLGGICGGDFNGDGFGDIVLLTGGSDEYHGQDLEYQLHFGNPWIDEDGVDVKREPDLFVDFGEEYSDYRHDIGNDLIGAVGDYNGDGVDDFAWRNSTKGQVLIFAGSQEWSSGVENDRNLPVEYDLKLKSYPNPFNSTVTISYTQPQAALSTVSIYDLTGRVVERLMQGEVQAGSQTLVWDASGVSAGEYLVRVDMGGETVSRKVVLVK